MYSRVRRIAAVLAGVLLLGASGCAGSVEPDVPIQYPTEGRTTALIPDPEATGELTVDLLIPIYDQAAQRAKEMYEALYPNVEVIVQQHDEAADLQQSMTALQAELMAGRGPDVFLATEESADLIKTMKAGAYADMAPYFRDDPAFNIADFNETILQAGQYQGRQYLIPLNYTFPLIITTQRIAEETGFRPDQCTDYFNTVDEIIRVLSALSEKEADFDQKKAFGYLAAPYLWTDYAGILKLDYPTGMVSMPEEEVRRVYEQLRQLSPYLYHQKERFQHPDNGAFISLTGKGTFFFENWQETMPLLTNDATLLYGAGETPLVLPYRDAEGKITALAGTMAAVNQGCKDKQNAYRFVKLLMSPEYAEPAMPDYNTDLFQVLQFPCCGKFPISNQALAASFEKYRHVPSLRTVRGELLPSGVLPQEFVDEIWGYIGEIDAVNLEPPVNMRIVEIMRPCIWGDASFEKCYSEAKNVAEIYISE